MSNQAKKIEKETTSFLKRDSMKHVILMVMLLSTLPLGAGQLLSVEGREEYQISNGTFPDTVHLKSLYAIQKRSALVLKEEELHGISVLGCWYGDFKEDAVYYKADIEHPGVFSLLGRKAEASVYCAAIKAQIDARNNK